VRRRTAYTELSTYVGKSTENWSHRPLGSKRVLLLPRVALPLVPHWAWFMAIYLGLFERLRKISRPQWQPLQLRLLEQHKIYLTISIQSDSPLLLPRKLVFLRAAGGLWVMGSYPYWWVWRLTHILLYSRLLKWNKEFGSEHSVYNLSFWARLTTCLQLMGYYWLTV
jgi:hypothetical protein